MQTTEEWILEPGDMLYLPPRVAHHGIAEGAGGCLTYSVGFRAPTVAALFSGFADFAAARLPDRRRSAHPALAPPADRKRVVSGTRVSERVALGGRRHLKK